MDRAKKRQIIQVVALLSSAVFCAALLAGHMIYHYSPSGRYKAGSTLLDPQVIDRVDYQDRHPSTGQKERFIFDHIDLSYQDAHTGQMRRQPISLEAYQAFYNEITRDESLEETEALETLFRGPYTPTLALYIQVKGQKGKEEAPRVFQILQIAPQQDYYRIQLIGQQNGEWAYFRHPHISQEGLERLTKSTSQ